VVDTAARVAQPAAPAGRSAVKPTGIGDGYQACADLSPERGGSNGGGSSTETRLAYESLSHRDVTGALVPGLAVS
jgi:hypothetical protein